MPSYPVGDVTLHAETHGDGFPLLLIAGTGLPSGIWGMHLPWMTASHKVVAFDNRDVGQSSSIDADYAPADMAADTLGLMDTLGIERADVLGFSLGGAIAQELALAHPDRVRGLILCSTWAATDEWLRIRFKIWERVATAGLRDVTSEQGLLDLFTHRFFASPMYEVMKGGFAGDPNAPQDGFIRQWRADQRHDAKDRLGSLPHPTLCVVGDEDILVPRRYTQELAELIPGATLEIIPEAGHGALFEAPQAFQAAIEPFLEGLTD